jgi:hypothetical protein
MTLLAAAYLARNGLRVLVLGQGTPEPTYRLGGYDLPRAPAFPLPLGSPGLRHLLEAVAVMPALKRRASSPSVAIPLRLPGRSLDLARDDRLRARSIEREFPRARGPMARFERRARAAREAFDQYVQSGGTLHGRGLRASRALSRLERQPVFGGAVARFDPLDELREEPRLVEAIQIYAQMASNHARAPAGLPLSLAYDRALEGTAHLDGGEHWLRQTIIERIESYGGDVRLRVSVDRVLVRGRAVDGLRLRSTMDEVGASAIIAGIPSSGLTALLSESSVEAQCVELLTTPTPSLARHVSNLAFAAEGIPRGLGRELFVVPARSVSRLLGCRLERTAGDTRLTWISAVSLVPWPLEDPDVLRARVIEAIRDVIPFADRHLRYVHSPNDELGVQRGAEPHDSIDDAPPGTAVETLDDLPRREPAGLVGLPTELPLEGLFLSNGQCFPELGAEGEVLASLDVCRRLLKKSGSARFSRLAPFRSRRW